MKTNIFIDACELLPDDIEYLNKMFLIFSSSGKLNDVCM